MDKVNSSYNLETITTKELESHIKCSIEMDQNIMYFGHRGIGKTQIPKEIIPTLGYKVLYLNLSLFERPDMGGYPDMFMKNEQRDNRFANYIFPYFYADLFDAQNKKVVAILDEIDKVDSSLNAPLLEFIADKSVNGIKLNNLKSIVLTGNLASEGGQKPISPLLDRSEKYFVEANADHWLDWAIKNNLHYSVIDFIRNNKKNLIGNIDIGENYSDETPRGWHRVSSILKSGEEKGIDSSILIQKVGGCVGFASKVKFDTYYKVYSDIIPIANMIYSGNLSDAKSKYDGLTGTNKIYLCEVIALKLKEVMKEQKSVVENIGKFFLESVNEEIIVVTIKSFIGIDKLFEEKVIFDGSWKRVLEKINAIKK